MIKKIVQLMLSIVLTGMVIVACSNENPTSPEISDNQMPTESRNEKAKAVPNHKIEFGNVDCGSEKLVYSPGAVVPGFGTYGGYVLPGNYKGAKCSFVSDPKGIFSAVVYSGTNQAQTPGSYPYMYYGVMQNVSGTSPVYLYDGYCPYSINVVALTFKFKPQEAAQQLLPRADHYADFKIEKTGLPTLWFQTTGSGIRSLIDVTSFDMFPNSSLEMNPNTTKTTQTTFIPFNADNSIVYTSSNPAVATVSKSVGNVANGINTVIRAVSVGNAVITGTIRNLDGSLSTRKDVINLTVKTGMITDPNGN